MRTSAEDTVDNTSTDDSRLELNTGDSEKTGDPVRDMDKDTVTDGVASEGEREEGAMVEDTSSITEGMLNTGEGVCVMVITTSLVSIGGTKVVNISSSSTKAVSISSSPSSMSGSEVGGSSVTVGAGKLVGMGSGGRDGELVERGRGVVEGIPVIREGSELGIVLISRSEGTALWSSDKKVCIDGVGVKGLTSASAVDSVVAMVVCIEGLGVGESIELVSVIEASAIESEVVCGTGLSMIEDPVEVDKLADSAASAVDSEVDIAVSSVGAGEREKAGVVELDKLSPAIEASAIGLGVATVCNTGLGVREKDDVVEPVKLVSETPPMVSATVVCATGVGIREEAEICETSSAAKEASTTETDCTTLICCPSPALGVGLLLAWT